MLKQFSSSREVSLLTIGSDQVAQGSLMAVEKCIINLSYEMNWESLNKLGLESAINLIFCVQCKI